MPTITPIYGFSKPLVDDPADEALWGGMLNANWDLAESLLSSLVEPVGSVAEMTAVASTQLTSNQAFLVIGYHPASSIGGGVFYWDSASSATPDGGLVIAADDTPVTGRWRRVVLGPLCATDFGAIPDDQASGTLAMAALPPGEYLLRHNIVTDALTVAGSGYSISTTSGATLTVLDPDGSHGRLKLHGDNNAAPYMRLNGQLEIGGASSGDRADNVVVGLVDITNDSSAASFRLQWANSPTVGHVEVALTGSEIGNQGVGFTGLRTPDIGYCRVSGNVSVGYVFVGSSTVAEPSIDGGTIGTLITELNDDYTGIESGHHGCYLKTCRNLKVGKIEVTGNGANAWSGSLYHIKLRDNQNCQFGALVTHDSADEFGLGSVFATSDGNSLAMNENFGNVYANVRGRMEAYRTEPGINRDCIINGLYGSYANTPKAVEGYRLRGTIEVPYLALGDMANDGIFENAVVNIPGMAADTVRFVREVRASNSHFLQRIEVYNDDIAFLDNCRVEGDIEMDSSAGDWTANIRNCSAAGTFNTHSFGTRTIVANIANTSFEANIPGSSNDRPTTENYEFVSFADTRFPAPSAAAIARYPFVIPASDPADWDAAPWVSPERRTVSGRTLSPNAQYAGLEQDIANQPEGQYELMMDVTVLSGNTTLSFAYNVGDGGSGDWNDVPVEHEIGVRKLSTLIVNDNIDIVAFAQDRNSLGFGSYTVHAFALTRLVENV